MDSGTSKDHPATMNMTHQSSSGSPGDSKSSSNQFAKHDNEHTFQYIGDFIVNYLNGYIEFYIKQMGGSIPAGAEIKDFQYSAECCISIQLNSNYEKMITEGESACLLHKYTSLKFPSNHGYSCLMSQAFAYFFLTLRGLDMASIQYDQTTEKTLNGKELIHKAFEERRERFMKAVDHDCKDKNENVKEWKPKGMTFSYLTKPQLDAHLKEEAIKDKKDRLVDLIINFVTNATSGLYLDFYKEANEKGDFVPTKEEAFGVQQSGKHYMMMTFNRGVKNMITNSPDRLFMDKFNEMKACVNHSYECLLTTVVMEAAAVMDEIDLFSYKYDRTTGKLHNYYEAVDNIYKKRREQLAKQLEHECNAEGEDISQWDPNKDMFQGEKVEKKQ